jgi:DNA replication factor GINS
MNLGDLQSTRSKERQKDSLQHLREDFYTDVGAFIAELRTERERAAEAADDPFDAPEVRRLTDDIETAEDTVEAVYERRVGKLVKLASLAAAGMPADRDGLTEEERDLFGTLVEAIESNRGHVLDGVLAGSSTDRTADSPTDAAETAGTATADDEDTHDETDVPSPATEPPTAPETVEPEGAGGTSGRESPPEAAGGVSAADVMGGETPDSTDEPVAEDDEPTADAPQAPSGAADTSDGGGSAQRGTERTTVRITRDVGEILGADERTYELASEDVVTLPDVNATPLLERDAAERLD